MFKDGGFRFIQRQLSILNDQNPVNDIEHRRFMRGDNHRSLAGPQRQLFHKGLFRSLVEIRGRFIKQDDVRIAQQGSGQQQRLALPVEGGQDEPRVHRAVLHGNYEFRQAEFRYGLNDAAIPLRINQLSIKAGERIAILGRIGAGKSTLLQAMMGNVELVAQGLNSRAGCRETAAPPG